MARRDINQCCGDWQCLDPTPLETGRGNFTIVEIIFLRLRFPTTQVTMCYNIFVLWFRFSLQWSYMGSKHQGRGTGFGLWWSSYVFSSKFKLCWLAFPKQCQKNKSFLWHMAMWTMSNHQECWQWAIWRHHWSLQVWTRYDENIFNGLEEILQANNIKLSK